MIIYLARNRGFCSGVKRSIRLAEKTLAEKPAPVHILNDIVHNRAVVDDLKSKGLNKVTDTGEVSSGTLLISAHGVPHDVISGSKARGLDVVDTTCPLVYKIHKAATDLTEKGYEVILFGDQGHDEVKGITSVNPDHIHTINSFDDIEKLPEFDGSVALISQSTKNVERFHQVAEKLLDKYGPIKIENTICRATRLRQESLIEVAKESELVIVVGSKTSANTNRLAEIARGYNSETHLIDSAEEMDYDWLDDIEKLGITSGASTPEYLVDDLIEKIKAYAEQEEIRLEFVNL